MFEVYFNTFTAALKDKYSCKGGGELIHIYNCMFKLCDGRSRREKMLQNKNIYFVTAV